MFSNTQLKDILQWTQATSSSKTLDLKVQAISTDSRTLAKGDVFLALCGPQFDGHQYISQAIDRGASALISEKDVAAPIPTLIVKNSLKALVAIGEKVRSQFHGPVVAVTGSAGKSSTKEMIATLLGEKTVKSPASFNNLIGVSKTCFLLQEDTPYLVLEMGMNALGEIAELCRHFTPTLGLITNIGDAHVGKMGGQENIYKAKKELFDYLTHGKIVINLDDPLVVKASNEKKSVQSISYSADGKNADIQILKKSMDPQTGHLHLQLSIRGKILEATLPIFGMHHAYNIPAAVATATLLHIPFETIKERISLIRPAVHRGEIFQLKNNVTLIDESYNSNPSALQSSLESLSHLTPTRRRVLVLGDMLEMGEYSKTVHEKAGEWIVDLSNREPQVIVGVGAEIQSLIARVRTLAPQFHCELVGNHAEAKKVLERLLKPNDLLLIKGSHSIALDRLVDSIV